MDGWMPCTHVSVSLNASVHTGEEGFMEHMKFTSGMFELLDEDGNGTVKKDEFIDMLETNPALLESFSSVLPSESPKRISLSETCG